MGSLVGSQDTWASPHPHGQCPWTRPHLQLTGQDTEKGGPPNYRTVDTKDTIGLAATEWTPRKTSFPGNSMLGEEKGVRAWSVCLPEKGFIHLNSLSDQNETEVQTMMSQWWVGPGLKTA